jgi:3'-phosphoadenosine 5'-phosphosulfate sulfotransferase (PAPS reductase)/FAD synthetase
MKTLFRHILSISGGKDSTAMYLKAIERGRPFSAVFCDTGHESPITYDYVTNLAAKTGGPEPIWLKADFKSDIERKRQYIKEKWAATGVPSNIIEDALSYLRPTGNPFLDLCMMKGLFPSAKARFCTEELKVKPIFYKIVYPLLLQKIAVISWQGVRADESIARSGLLKWQRLEPLTAIADWENPRYFAYRPLLSWTVEDVWAMHRKHGVEPNPLYSQGMGRVGCMPCIMCRKTELREIARRFPAEIARVAEWEQTVSKTSKRGSTTLFAVCDDPVMRKVEPIRPETHGIHSRVEWAKTSRGGKQYTLDLPSQFIFDAGTACNAWGACE